MDMEPGNRKEGIHLESSRVVINVGSRNSQLALIQTNQVIKRLQDFYANNLSRLENLLSDTRGCRESELVFNTIAMTTTGDRILEKPLPEIGSKSLFTKELEVELIEGRVDFIVHSLKDLPTTLPDGCVIGAIMKRDDPNDAIVIKKSLIPHMKPLDLLLGRCQSSEDSTIKIGTSSQRRIAMLRRCNAKAECVNIRGNLNTRLAKLDREDGEYAAIILAKAGLDRMGWSERSSYTLTAENDNSMTDWCYAVGQGAIAVECRRDDARILELLKPIVDLRTMYEAIAERSLMKKLEGGCSVPLGVRSSWEVEDDCRTLSLKGIVLSLDGKQTVRASSKTTLTGEEIKVAARDDIRHDDLVTTGITLSRSALLDPALEDNMKRCAILGVDVANKMIDLGCIKLIELVK